MEDSYEEELGELRAALKEAMVTGFENALAQAAVVFPSFLKADLSSTGPFKYMKGGVIREQFPACEALDGEGSDDEAAEVEPLRVVPPGATIERAEEDLIVVGSADFGNGGGDNGYEGSNRDGGEDGNKEGGGDDLEGTAAVVE